MQLKNVAKKFVVRKNPLHKTIKKILIYYMLKSQGPFMKRNPSANAKKYGELFALDLSSLNC